MCLGSFFLTGSVNLRITPENFIMLNSTSARVKISLCFLVVNTGWPRLSLL